MIELSRHIESLLLKHDCVIVPGLGGFVTQYVPARRIDDEQLFLPPCRSVGFNPELSINDGLLAQSYMHAYDSTYPESLKLIEDAVAQLKGELVEKGEFALHGIGIMRLGVDGHYHFEPCEAGVVSPELYGLDSLVLPLAHASEAADEKEAEPMAPKAKIRSLKPKVRRTEQSYTISLNRELVNYVAAAVVALFFYFVWATPVGSPSLVEKQNAAIISQQLFHCSKPQPKVQPVAIGADKEKAAPSSQPVEKESLLQKQEAQKEQDSRAGRYTIVLASAIPQSNASELVTRLQGNGLKEANTYVRGRMVRVVYGNYATQAEAQQSLMALRKHPNFAQAWVMQVQ